MSLFISFCLNILVGIFCVWRATETMFVNPRWTLWLGVLGGANLGFALATFLRMAI